jgi:hypothetical protein
MTPVELYRFTGLFQPSSSYTYTDIYPSPKFRMLLFDGYFQNYRWVDEAMPSMRDELRSLLVVKQNEIGKYLNDSSFAVIHFRRGDLVHFRDSMGLLNSSYFHRAIEIVQEKSPEDFPVYILTDDVSEAKKVFNDTEFSIIGSDQMSAWQSLALMTKAKYLVTSNSTLSWWGGRLNAVAEKVIITPEPWFKNWHEPVGDAFHIDGAIKLPSIFQ